MVLANHILLKVALWRFTRSSLRQSASLAMKSLIVKTISRVHAQECEHIKVFIVKECVFE